MTDLGLYYRKVKRATEEDSSTLEWLNGHFNNLKFTFSEELEKLDNDTNSGSMESLLIDAGANITVAISMLLIMTYARRSIGRSSNTALYLFRKHFQNFKSPLRFHHYCSNCLIYVPGKKKNKNMFEYLL